MVNCSYSYNIKKLKRETAYSIEIPLQILMSRHKTKTMVSNRTAAVGRPGVFTNNSVRRLCNKSTVYKCGLVPGAA